MLTTTELVNFYLFFFIVKIYKFGYILIFGWIDINLGIGFG